MMNNTKKQNYMIYKLLALFAVLAVTLSMTIMSAFSVEVMVLETGDKLFNHDTIKQNAGVVDANTTIGIAEDGMDFKSVWQEPSDVTVDIPTDIASYSATDNAYVYNIDAGSMVINTDFSNLMIGTVRYENAIKIGSKSYDFELLIGRAINSSAVPVTLSIAKDKPKVSTTASEIYFDFAGRVLEHDTNDVVTPPGLYLSVSAPTHKGVLLLKDHDVYLGTDDAFLDQSRPKLNIDMTEGISKGAVFNKDADSTKTGSIVFNYSSIANAQDEGYLSFGQQINTEASRSISDESSANSVTLQALVTSHKVKFVAGEGVSITDDDYDEQTIENEGNVHKPTYTLSEGYRFKNYTCNKDVKINGVTREAGSSISEAELSVIPVTDNLTFTVNASQLLKLKVSVVYGRADINGGDEVVDQQGVMESYTEENIDFGANRTVNYEPALTAGLQLSQIIVDGRDVSLTENRDSYTFNDMQDDHEISIIYEKVPELSITKSVVSGSDANTDGDKVDYEVHFQQTIEGAIAKEVVVTDSIPSGLELDESSINVTGVTGASYEVQDGKIIVSVDNLPQADGVLKYSARTTAAAGTFTNNVGLSAKNAKEDKTASATVNVGTPALSVSKVIASSDKNPKRGEVVSYTVTITNTGGNGSEVRVASVLDTLPDGLGDVTITTAKADGNDITSSLSYSNGKITGNLGNFKNNVVITYQAKATKAYGEIKNTVKASGFVQSTQAGASRDIPLKDAQATATTSIVGPSLSVDKKTSREFTYYNDDFTYTVEVKNARGGTYANDFVLSEAVDPATSKIDYDSITVKTKDGEDVACTKEYNASSTKPEFKIKVEKLDKDIVVTYKVHVNEKSGQLTSSSKIESPDDKDLPKSKTVSTEIKKPVFEFEKKQSKRVIDPSGVMTYTVSIKETVGVNATNVVFEDAIPEGLALDEASVKVDGAAATSTTYENGVLRIVFDRFEGNATVTYSGDVTAPDGGHLINAATLSCDNIDTISKAKTDAYVTVDIEEDEDESSSHSGSHSKENSGNSDSSSNSNGKSDGTSASSSDSDSSSSDANSSDEGKARSNAQTGDYIMIIAVIILICAAAGIAVTSMRKKSKSEEDDDSDMDNDDTDDDAE